MSITMEETSSKKVIEDCKLSLPDGLRELMSDISREVLRAQPSNLYGFIANYLSALLVTRVHLSVADQVCDYVCQCDCQPELLCELGQLGLDEHNTVKVRDIILKYLQKAEVKEENILAALLAKTNIEADMYPAVVDAVRLAYIRHQSHYKPRYELPSDHDKDEIAAAVAHTLKLYQQSEPADGLYGAMATKIQAAYRAYGVRREIASKKEQEITVRTYMSKAKPEEVAPTSNDSSISERMKQDIQLTTSLQLARIKTDSSISLAGSFCVLPRNKPYNAKDIVNLSLLEETEKEHSQFDYTVRSPNTSLIGEEDKKFSHSDKRISFQETSEDEIFEDVAVPKEQEKDMNKEELSNYDECDDESVATELSEETVSEEVVEIENDDNDNEKTGVNEIDREYIKVMNLDVDTDSGEDIEAQ